ncbi:hypothetical protein Spirs_3385 [Sediminispirochaeta smaragdinae DSM 11293]|uniref:Uncharacterized protein n=2 Tax=Sediminispirochaeta TaxID=1911556 RepID=E1R2B6_SEDSS|nr:hypothetical protein Spirs_3385 [Sediminispirochaeta smaragdinae DSM 11293]
MIWLRFLKRHEAQYNRKLSFKDEPFPEESEPFGLSAFDFYASRLSRLLRRAGKKEKIYFTGLRRQRRIRNKGTFYMQIQHSRLYGKRSLRPNNRALPRKIYKTSRDNTDWLEYAEDDLYTAKLLVESHKPLFEVIA